jgi:hypothetical protein
MFNATEILIDAFVNEIRDGYRRTYGCFKNDYQDIIAWAGNMALENIAATPFITMLNTQSLLPWWGKKSCVANTLGKAVFPVKIGCIVLFPY